MGDKIRQFCTTANFLPFVVLFLVMLAFFAGVDTAYGDDQAFRTALGGTTPWQMALDYRQTWSARIVIEVVYFTLYTLPPLVWQVLQCLMVVLMAYAFTRLAGTQRQVRANWLACGVVAVYPLAEMISAGWMSTSCNYLWPIALGLYALVPWVDTLCSRKTHPVTAVLAILALVYAANAEQVLAVLLGFVVLAVIWMLVKKQKPRVVQWIGLAVLAGMVVQLLLAPGPALRQAEEVARFNPDFHTQGIWIRLYNVFFNMSWYLLTTRSITFLLASIMVALIIFNKYKSAAKRGLALFPLVAGLAMGVLFPAASTIFPGLANLQAGPYSYGFLSETAVYLPAVLYACMWLSLLVSLYFCGATQMQSLALCVVFLAGFCSQLIMCMVPSADSSYQRYTTMMHFALLLAAFMLVLQISASKKPQPERLARYSVAVLSLGNVVNLFLSW